MSTLISNGAGSLTLLPLNALNQVVPGFTPAAGNFTMADNTAANYPITSVTWDTNTGLGTMVFTAPVVASRVTRTLTISMNGTPITVNPSPITTDIVPPYSGFMVLTNAWLAWDMVVPNATSLTLADYSGNNNYATTGAANYFQVGAFTSGTVVHLTPTVTLTVNRAAFSSSGTPPNRFFASETPILNPTSLAAATFAGRPLNTIATVLWFNLLYDSLGTNMVVWTYSYNDGQGQTRGVRLLVTDNGAGITLTLQGLFGGMWESYLTSVAASAYITSGGLIAMLTVTMNADNSASLYANGTLLATGSVASTNGVGNPPQTGTQTLTYFGGLGDGGFGLQNFYSYGAQLELVAYTDIKTQPFIATNAHAWGLI